MYNWWEKNLIGVVKHLKVWYFICRSFSGPRSSAPPPSPQMENFPLFVCCHRILKKLTSPPSLQQLLFGVRFGIQMSLWLLKPWSDFNDSPFWIHLFWIYFEHNSRGSILVCNQHLVQNLSFLHLCSESIWKIQELKLIEKRNALKPKVYFYSFHAFS